MKTLALLLVLLVAVAVPASAQRDPLVSPLPSILPADMALFQQTVDRANELLARDVFDGQLLAQSDFDSQDVGSDVIVKGKSPRRAFLMSVLVPGSGELYAGAKKRAALFFGLEVIALGMYMNWNGEGNDLEDGFRARADTTWNPWDYLGWRGSRNARFSSITHALPCSVYVASAPSTTLVPDAISRCPDRDKQQYYELIGKYDQFVSGWDDVIDGDGNRVTASQVDSAENFSSETRLSYEIDRDDSNKLLKRATNAAGLILVNHVISAIDAARVARARNLGESEAVLERRTRFAFGLGGGTGRTPMLLAFRPVH